jgi:hypothetical protein
MSSIQSSTNNNNSSCSARADEFKKSLERTYIFQGKKELKRLERLKKQAIEYYKENPVPELVVTSDQPVEKVEIGNTTLFIVGTFDDDPKNSNSGKNEEIQVTIPEKNLNNEIQPLFNNKLEEEKEFLESTKNVIIPQVTIPETDSETLAKKKRAERKEKYAQLALARAGTSAELAKQVAEKDAQYIPIRYNMHEERIRRIAKAKHNAEGYKNRIAQRENVYDLHKPTNAITAAKRMFLYQRYHFCPHKLKHTILSYNQEKAEFNFSCNHASMFKPGIEWDKQHLESLTRQNLRCKRCSHLLTFNLLTSCGCDVALCKTCKSSNFYYPSEDLLQLMDKHCGNNIVIASEGGWGLDRYGSDVSAWINDYVRPKRQPKSNRINFYRELQSKQPLTFAQVMKIKDDNKISKVNKIPQVETIPQGGAVSSMVSPVTGMFSSIKSTLIDIRDKVESQLRSLIEKLLGMKYVGPVIRAIIKFIKTFRYCIQTLINYVMNINPISLVRLYLERSDKLKTVANVASIAYEIEKSELAAVHKYSAWLCFNTEPDNLMIDVAKRIKENQFGVITEAVHAAADTFLANKFKDKNERRRNFFDLINPYSHTIICREYLSLIFSSHEIIPKVYSVPEKVEPTILQTFKDNVSYLYNKFTGKKAEIKVKTTTPTQPQGMLDLVTSFFSSVPSQFLKHSKYIVAAISHMKNDIMAMNGLAQLSKHVSTFINFILSKIFVDNRTTKEWLAYKMHSEGNPIYDAVQAYMAYQLATVDPKHNKRSAVAANDLRSHYYTTMIAAQEYAIEHKKNTVEFLDWKYKMDQGMTVPPVPTAREHEPFVLTLSGPPGTGKSRIWQALVAHEFLSKEERKEDVQKQISAMTHTWNVSESFQPGMSTKKIILFDDFQQNKDSNEEALSVIGLVSSAAFPINSPVITGPEIKGCCASPDLVVICTNLSPDLAGEGLHSTEALTRRQHLNLEIKKRLDFNKPDEEFIKVTACQRYADLVGRTITLETAQMIFSVAYDQHRKAFKKVTDNLEKVVLKDFDLKKLILNDNDISTIKNPWQENKNFTKDFEETMKMKRQSGENVKGKEEDPIISDEEEEDSTKPPPKFESKKTNPFQSQVNSFNSFADLEPNKQSQSILESEDFPSLTSKQTKPQAGYTMSKTDLLSIAGYYLTSGIAVGTAISTGYTLVSTMYSITDMLGIKMASGITSNQSIRSVLEPVFSIIFGIIIAGFSSYAAVKLISEIRNHSIEQSGTTKTAKPSTSHPIVPTRLQAGGYDQLSVLYRKATGSVRVVSTGTTLNCVFVKGHYILLPLHFFYHPVTFTYYEDGELMQINKSNWNKEIKNFVFERSRMRFLGGNINAEFQKDINFRQDVVLYQLDSKLFSASQDIVKHFWDGDYSVTNYDVIKYDYVGFKSREEIDGEFIIGAGKVTAMQVRTNRKEGSTKTYVIVAQASYPERDSSCGSLIRKLDQEKPLLGIHVARGKLNGDSYFHFVTSSALNDAIDNPLTLADTEKIIELETWPQYCTDFLPEKSSLKFEGIVHPPVYQNVKTDLQPSAVFEFYGNHTTEPAPLSGKDPRLSNEFKGDAFYKQLFIGYTTTQKAFEEEELRIPVQSMKDYMKRMNHRSIVPQKILSLHECLNGIQNLPENTRMDMTTSMGWPYSAQGIKKDSLFSIDSANNIVASARIQEEFEIACQQIRAGIVPVLPFSLSFKDERIKIAKIEVPKTRIFACGNIIHFMLMRKYFYTTLMQFYHNPIKHSFCIPRLDRLSLDWHDLSSYMLEVGENGFDFDFKFWDRSIQKILIYYAVEILLHTQNVTQLEKETLCELISSPFMIYRDMLYQSCGMVMSGSLLTYIINCVINELIHRTAFLSISSKISPQFSSVRIYEQYTRGLRGGDDTITTFDERLSHFYNGRIVSEFFKSKGLDVTATDKSLVIPEKTPFMRLSFLKNQTGISKGWFIPLPEIASLIESMYWIRLNKYNNDPIKATEDNVICSLRGLYFHGMKKYNEIRELVLEKCPLLTLPSYFELNNIWRKFYAFPGAHADYATKELQDHPFDMPSQQKIPEYKRQCSDQLSDKYHKMMQIETQTQSGKALDKQQLEFKEIQTVNVTDQTPSVPQTSVDNNSNSDAAKKDVTRVGATIQDADTSTLVAVHTGSITNTSRNNRAEAYANDLNWDLKMLEHKFTFVKDVNWATTDTFGTFLTTLDIPRDIIITPAQKTPFDVTRLWKCSNVLIKVVLKASPFYAGSLGLGFMPFPGTPEIRKLINLGAMIQKVSQNEGIEFSIPFRYRTGLINIETDNLGKFVIFVISPLRTGPSNPSNISMSIYAAIENSEFKIPEVVASAKYVSPKFDKNIMLVSTIPQSGLAHENQQVCDINMPIESMPTTMLCAGEGTLGKVDVAHFQDAPLDLVQLCKRWTPASTYKITIPAGKRVRVTIPYNEIMEAATRGLTQSYGFVRGSINVRINSIGGSEGFVSFSADSILPTLVQQPIPFLNGIHYFNNTQVAQFTIPWLSRFFVDYSSQLNGHLLIFFDNYTTASITNYFEMMVSVGDDFHMGLYLGMASDVFKAKTLELTATQTDIPVIPLVPTLAQAGVVDFIDRALETTLPVVEKISKLGQLLDAHMITYQPYPIQTRQLPYSIATDLPQYTERLLTTNHNGMSLPDDQCFGSDRNETDIYNLMTSTKTLLATVPWTAVDTAGALLYESVTGPLGKPNVEGAPHDTIPDIFNFWTGSTIYLLDIIATEMHRGQLLITYTPNNVDTIDYPDATQTYFTSYDLSQGRGTIALNLPYISEVPYRNVIAAGDAYSNASNSGKIQIFVQNPLRSTATVSSDCEIIIYKAYGRDFNLGVFGRYQVIPAKKHPFYKSQ